MKKHFYEVAVVLSILCFCLALGLESSLDEGNASGSNDENRRISQDEPISDEQSKSLHVTVNVKLKHAKKRKSHKVDGDIRHQIPLSFRKDKHSARRHSKQLRRPKRVRVKRKHRMVRRKRIVRIRHHKKQRVWRSGLKKQSGQRIRKKRRKVRRKRVIRIRHRKKRIIPRSELNMRRQKLLRRKAMMRRWREMNKKKKRRRPLTRRKEILPPKKLKKVVPDSPDTIPTVKRENRCPALQCDQGDENADCTKCLCMAGYTGKKCNVPCKLPCENGGNFAKSESGACKCECRQPFIGKHCEKCPAVKCSKVGGVMDKKKCKCKCKKYWAGASCDNCTLKCKHGTLDKKSCKCKCMKGWHGPSCDRNCFSGYKVGQQYIYGYSIDINLDAYAKKSGQKSTSPEGYTYFFKVAITPLAPAAGHESAMYFALQVEDASATMIEGPSEAKKRYPETEVAKLQAAASKPFYYKQDCVLLIDRVFYPNGESKGLVKMKKGIAGVLSKKVFTSRNAQSVEDTYGYLTHEVTAHGPGISDYDVKKETNGCGLKVQRKRKQTVNKRSKKIDFRVKQVQTTCMREVEKGKYIDQAVDIKERAGLPKEKKPSGKSKVIENTQVMSGGSGKVRLEKSHKVGEEIIGDAPDEIQSHDHMLEFLQDRHGSDFSHAKLYEEEDSLPSVLAKLRHVSSQSIKDAVSHLKVAGQDRIGYKSLGRIIEGHHDGVKALSPAILQLTKEYKQNRAPLTAISTAFNALIDFGGDEGQNTVSKYVCKSCTSDSIKNAALIALGSIETPTASTINAVSDILPEDGENLNNEIHHQASLVLGTLGSTLYKQGKVKKAHEIEDRLRGRLNTAIEKKDLITAERAIMSLQNAAMPRSGSHLISLSHHKEPLIRGSAVGALAYIQHPMAATTLLKTFANKTEHNFVRWKAIHAIANKVKKTNKLSERLADVVSDPNTHVFMRHLAAYYTHAEELGHSIAPHMKSYLWAKDYLEGSDPNVTVTNTVNDMRQQVTNSVPVYGNSTASMDSMSDSESDSRIDDLSVGNGVDSVSDEESERLRQHAEEILDFYSANNCMARLKGDKYCNNHGKLTPRMGGKVCFCKCKPHWTGSQCKNKTCGKKGSKGYLKCLSKRKNKCNGGGGKKKKGGKTVKDSRPAKRRPRRTRTRTKKKKGKKDKKDKNANSGCAAAEEQERRTRYGNWIMPGYLKAVPKNPTWRWQRKWGTGKVFAAVDAAFDNKWYFDMAGPFLDISFFAGGSAYVSAFGRRLVIVEAYAKVLGSLDVYKCANLHSPRIKKSPVPAESQNMIKAGVYFQFLTKVYSLGIKKELCEAGNPCEATFPSSPTVTDIGQKTLFSFGHTIIVVIIPLRFEVSIDGGVSLESGVIGIAGLPPKPKRNGTKLPAHLANHHNVDAKEMAKLKVSKKVQFELNGYLAPIGNVFVSGKVGVDILVGAGGVGLQVKIIGAKVQGAISYNFHTKMIGVRVDLTLTALGGRGYAWVRLGFCPFCKEWDITMFKWSGLSYTWNLVMVEACKWCKNHCYMGWCNRITGQCTCHHGWHGSHCHIACPGLLQGYGVCRYRGNPKFGTKQAPGCVWDKKKKTTSCVCQKGYWGPDCWGICPGGTKNECNNKGKCDQMTGQCRCFKGYLGDVCDLKCPGVGTKKGVCNGHGVCLAHGRRTSCRCHKGWVGEFCEYGCPTNKKGEICSDSGKCIISKKAGHCKCSIGFTGRVCEDVSQGAMTAIRLHDSADFVQLPYFTFSSGFSIEFWVKLDSTQFSIKPAHSILNFVVNNVSKYSIVVQNGKLHVKGKTAIGITTAANIRSWIHVAIMTSKTQSVLSIQGIASNIGVTLGDCVSVPVSFVFGAFGGVATARFDLDEIRVWSRKKHLSEIKFNKNRVLGSAKNMKGLTMYYRFDEGGGRFSYSQTLHESIVMRAHLGNKAHFVTPNPSWPMHGVRVQTFPFENEKPTITTRTLVFSRPEENGVALDTARLRLKFGAVYPKGKLMIRLNGHTVKQNALVTNNYITYDFSKRQLGNINMYGYNAIQLLAKKTRKTVKIKDIESAENMDIETGLDSDLDGDYERDEFWFRKTKQSKWKIKRTGYVKKKLPWYKRVKNAVAGRVRKAVGYARKLVKKGAKVVKRGYKKFKILAKKGYGKFKKIVRKGWNKVKRIAKKGVKLAKKVFQKLKSGAKRIAKAIVKGIKKGYNKFVKWLKGKYTVRPLEVVYSVAGTVLEFSMKGINRVLRGDKQLHPAYIKIGNQKKWRNLKTFTMEAYLFRKSQKILPWSQVLCSPSAFCLSRDGTRFHLSYHIAKGVKSWGQNQTKIKDENSADEMDEAEQDEERELEENCIRKIKGKCMYKVCNNKVVEKMCHHSIHKRTCFWRSSQGGCRHYFCKVKEMVLFMRKICPEEEDDEGDEERDGYGGLRFRWRFRPIRFRLSRRRHRYRYGFRLPRYILPAGIPGGPCKFKKNLGWQCNKGNYCQKRICYQACAKSSTKRHNKYYCYGKLNRPCDNGECEVNLGCIKGICRKIDPKALRTCTVVTRNVCRTGKETCRNVCSQVCSRGRQTCRNATTCTVHRRYWGRDSRRCYTKKVCTVGKTTCSNKCKQKCKAGVKKCFDADETDCVQRTKPAAKWKGADKHNVTMKWPSRAIPLRTWTHLAVSYDGFLLKIFINGIMIEQKLIRGVVMDVKSPVITLSDGFDGYVDELRIWKAARSTFELREYRTRIIRFGGIDSAAVQGGMLAYFNFECYSSAHCRQRQRKDAFNNILKLGGSRTMAQFTSVHSWNKCPGADKDKVCGNTDKVSVGRCEMIKGKPPFCNCKGKAFGRSCEKKCPGLELKKQRGHVREHYCKGQPCCGRGSCYLDKKENVARCKCQLGFIGPACQYACPTHKSIYFTDPTAPHVTVMKGTPQAQKMRVRVILLNAQKHQNFVCSGGGQCYAKKLKTGYQAACKCHSFAHGKMCQYGCMGSKMSSKYNLPVSNVCNCSACSCDRINHGQPTCNCHTKRLGRKSQQSGICNIKLCLPNNPFYNFDDKRTCSGHGRCDKHTGICSCAGGWGYNNHLRLGTTKMRSNYCACRMVKYVSGRKCRTNGWGRRSCWNTHAWKVGCPN